MLKIRKIDIIILSMIFSLIISILFLKVLNTKIKPFLIEFVKSEASKIESTVVNKSINEILKDEYDMKNLFNYIKSSDGTIETIDFDSDKVNKLLSILTIKIQNYLTSLEKGIVEDLGVTNININRSKYLNLKKGIILEVPIGSLSDNILFAGLGPKLPIKLHYLSDINSNVSIKLREYGINNALMEMYVNVEISARVLLPFISEKIILSTNIPVAIKMLQGKIPTYYGNSISKDSNIYSLPIE